MLIKEINYLIYYLKVVIYFSLKLFRVYRSYLSNIRWVSWVILEYT